MDSETRCKGLARGFQRFKTSRKLSSKTSHRCPVYERDKIRTVLFEVGVEGDIETHLFPSWPHSLLFPSQQPLRLNGMKTPQLSWGDVLVSFASL